MKTLDKIAKVGMIPVSSSSLEGFRPTLDGSIQPLHFATCAASKLCLITFFSSPAPLWQYCSLASLKSKASGLRCLSVSKHRLNADPASTFLRRMIKAADWGSRATLFFFFLADLVPQFFLQTDGNVPSRPPDCPTPRREHQSLTGLKQSSCFHRVALGDQRRVFQ